MTRLCYNKHMNSWSRRRKRIIFLIVFFTLLIVVGLPVYFLFYRAPTCFDGKLNGSETGVDCGGSCQLLCTAESLPLITKGDPKVLRVTENLFETVVLVENPNASGEIYRAGYIFKLYDASSSVPVKIIEGETYVPKGTTFAVFQPPFSIESGAVPTRTTFEWKQDTLIWRQNVKILPEVVSTDLRLSRETTNPRLDANLENLSLEDISNIDLVALISDGTGSVFAASKTFVDILPASTKVPVVFTWPRPFNGEAIDIDIIIRILPDGSFIR